jgi:hypothetical protein
MSNFLSKSQSTDQSNNQIKKKNTLNADGIYHTILHLCLVDVISKDSDAKQMNRYSEVDTYYSNNGNIRHQRSSTELTDVLHSKQSKTRSCITL